MRGLGGGPSPPPEKGRGEANFSCVREVSIFKGNQKAYSKNWKAFRRRTQGKAVGAHTRSSALVHTGGGCSLRNETLRRQGRPAGRTFDAPRWGSMPREKKGRDGRGEAAAKGNRGPLTEFGEKKHLFEPSTCAGDSSSPIFYGTRKKSNGRRPPPASCRRGPGEERAGGGGWG